MISYLCLIFSLASVDIELIAFLVSLDISCLTYLETHAATWRQKLTADLSLFDKVDEPYCDRVRIYY